VRYNTTLSPTNTNTYTGHHRIYLLGLGVIIAIVFELLFRVVDDSTPHAPYFRHMAANVVLYLTRVLLVYSFYHLLFPTVIVSKLRWCVVLIFPPLMRLLTGPFAPIEKHHEVDPTISSASFKALSIIYTFGTALCNYFILPKPFFEYARTDGKHRPIMLLRCSQVAVIFGYICAEVEIFNIVTPIFVYIILFLIGWVVALVYMSKRFTQSKTKYFSFLHFLSYASIGLPSMCVCVCVCVCLCV